MRVAALVHFFPPFRCAGSETVALELLKAAADDGHEVRVWVTHRDSQRNWTGREPDTKYEGLTIHRVRNAVIGGQKMKAWRPDVIFSHHDHSMHAVRCANQIGARSVFAVHNDHDLNQRPLRARPDLVLFNSDWVAESLSRFGDPKQSMIFHPPLTADRHVVEKIGDAVTLINLNADKGALIFYDLAARMPDTKFLGVVGGHGVQVVRRNLPNVTILDHGPDMKRVWERTRILLMPSVYESYGLTAVEAGINGIPTIANPTPGLMENLGERGLFVDRDNVEGWVHEIRRLEHGSNYSDASGYARSRAALALDATRDTLKKWCAWLNG